MKKIIKSILVAIICLIPVSGFAYEEANGVILNGQQIYSDVKPVIVEGRTMIPARALLEALGMKVSWNGNTGMVTGEKYGKRIDLTTNGNGFDRRNKYNGIEIFIEEVPPMIIRGRTMIPVRMVSEVIGLSVGWDGYSRNVIITEPTFKPRLTLDDAYWIIKSKYPVGGEFDISFPYLPFGGYARNNNYVMGNYYVFGYRDYYNSWDFSLCVDKNTGQIREYGDNGFIY